MGIPITHYEEFEYLKQKAMKHDLTKNEQDLLCKLMQSHPITRTVKMHDGTIFTYVVHPFFDNQIKIRRQWN